MLKTSHQRSKGKKTPIRADRLKQAREQAGLSQHKLSELCEFGEKQIWRAENGKGDPSADHLGRIARQLNVSADWLLGLTDSPTGFLTPEALSQDERKLITAFRRNDLEVVFDMLRSKFRENPPGKIGVARRKPKVEK